LVPRSFRTSRFNASSRSELRSRLLAGRLASLPRPAPPPRFWPGGFRGSKSARRKESEIMRTELDRLCEKHRVKVTSIETEAPAEGDWSPQSMPGAMHWKVQLRAFGRQLTTEFHQGPAICREPTAADVLHCLCSDSVSVDNAQSFEDWANELGYDSDSRRAEKLFRACEKAAVRLHRFLGDHYGAFIRAEH
jgi:hypothetical protein